VCQFDKAETYINDAQEIFEELDIKDRAAWCLLNRAAIKRSQGVHEQAALLNKKALQYFSPLKNHDGVAWTLFQTGQILHDQGQLTKAWQTIREALNLHSDISNRKGLGWGESEWGQIYMELNDHVHARECFARAKVIGEQLDIVPLKLDVEKNISLYYLDEGQLTKATDLLQKLDIKCEKIESWEINADVLLALAKANAIIGNWPRVRLEIEEAKRLSETYNLARLKPVVGLYLAELLVSEGKPDNAKKILQEVSKLSKDTNQRRQHAEALLGLVQLEKKEKTAAQLSATLDLIEKDVRAISSRKLKAKFLMVRALLNFTVSRSVDVKVISQALQIAESTGLFVLKKQLLDIVSAMYQQDKKERDWSDSQDELRQFLDKNSPDLSLVANRSQFLNSMPVSITL
jgi:tetratricopeptide (TPR) repeat protein